jgi:hypothetical protein
MNTVNDTSRELTETELKRLLEETRPFSMRLCMPIFLITASSSVAAVRRLR